MARLDDTHYGTFAGTGRWRDDKGETHAYRVNLYLSPRDEGLGLSFVHEFHEEPDAEDIDLSLIPVETAPSLLKFEIGPIEGRGYQTRHLVHFDIPMPDTMVETTYLFDNHGNCHVWGSSQSNADGNHIMWTETLTRTDY